jgi:sugar phosphate isomerase/epimerase
MHDRISINAICFPEAPFDQVTDYWRELGAHRVSVISPLLPLGNLAHVQHALKKGGYELETIMHPFLAGQHLDADEAHHLDASTRFSQFIAAAIHLRARSIYTVAGGHGSLTWEDAAERFCHAIAPCIVMAKEAGIALMIENSPSLYAEVHIAHSLRDAITLSEMAGIGVVIDVFGCWTEAGLRDSIRRAIPRCQLVQLSDYVYGDRAVPSRAVPGDGAIPLRRILEWVLEAGYSGNFDLELVGPRIDQEGHLSATRRAAENVSAILHSLGA